MLGNMAKKRVNVAVMNRVDVEIAFDTINDQQILELSIKATIS